MTSMQSTIDKLYEMRMTTMARAYRDQDSIDAISQMDFDERLAMIVDAEWDSRRINKRIRLLRQAQLAAPDANITDVCYDADRNLDRDRIIQLSGCDWVKNKRNVVITGATGAGKTWLACALGVAACNQFYTVRYIRMPALLDMLCIKKDDDWLKTKKRYITCDVLIIDDWMLEALSLEQSRELLEIVETRNGQGSLMLCSQFSAGGWAEKIGEGPVAEAIVDRIIHNSYVLHIEGKESMRKRMSNLL